MTVDTSGGARHVRYDGELVTKGEAAILALLDENDRLREALRHILYSNESDLSVYAKDCERVARAALESSGGSE